MKCQKVRFDIDPDVTYLNCAYQSPLTRAVVQAGQAGLLRKVNPHQVTSNDFFEPLEDLKSLFAQLINAMDPQRVAYLPSVSYGLATVANNLPHKIKGNIVMPGGIFPSSYYALAELAKRKDYDIRLVEPPTTFANRSMAWNTRMLEAIDKDTICVCCDHIHWMDGTIFDLPAFRDRTAELDAWLVIDGTQSVGAYSIDVSALQPDAVICAGYKYLMGPYGTALAYYGEKMDHGDPIEYHWMPRQHSERFNDLTNYQGSYRAKAYRYNVGQPANFVFIPMLQTAIQEILEWRVDHIQEYCSKLFRPFRQAILDKGYVYDSSGVASHLFGIYHQGSTSLKNLKEKMALQKIHVSIRGNAVRIAPHIYNNSADAMKFVEAL